MRKIYAAGMAARADVAQARSLYVVGQLGRAQLGRGMAGLYREGRAARWGRDTAGPIIGASMFQTPGGIQAEIGRINSDMLIFSKEISDAIERKGYPTDPASHVDPLVIFFVSVWSPFVREWQSFYADHSGWWGNLWWNHAPHAEEFQTQLIELRKTASDLGMAVASPGPVLPQPNPIEKLLGMLWGLVRTIVYGGLAIAGAWTLWGVYKQARMLGTLGT